MLPEIIKLWDHQRQAVSEAIKQRDYSLFMDMGTGKTATSINILRHRFHENKRVMRTLILCPIVVVENWKREILAHSKITKDHILTLTNSGKDRTKTFEPIAKDRQGKIVITNFQALGMTALYTLLTYWQPEIIIVDESQRIKNSKAVTTKKAIALGDTAKHRYILSGTPILRDGMDIFSQYRFLDKGETFGTNFFTFRNHYFVDHNANMPPQKYFPNWKPRPNAHADFNKLIYRKAIRVLKKDCLDLPPFVRKKITVGMTPQQEKNYREMEKDFVTFLGDKACTAQLALVKALRLQQIVSGFFKITEEEDSPPLVYKDCPRLNALSEIIEMIPDTEKIIIWAHFRENHAHIANLLTKLGLTYTTLTGSISANDKQKNVDEFQNNPACRIMLAGQSAGGVGVNLTQASYCIYFSRSFSLEADLQSEARNYRGGSEIHTKITRIDLVAEGTIDEIILEALQRKENIAADILAFKERFL